MTPINRYKREIVKNNFDKFINHLSPAETINDKPANPKPNELKRQPR